MRALLVCAALAVVTPALAAEPHREAAFGFWKGMSLKEVQAAAKLQQPYPGNIYVTTDAPKPVAPFVAYGLVIGRQVGVCSVSAFTNHLPDGSRQQRNEALVILQMLGNLYGEPTEKEKESPDGPLTTVKWQDAKGPHTLVTFTMHHTDDGTAYVHVDYTFSNMVECRAEMQKDM